MELHVETILYLVEGLYPTSFITGLLLDDLLVADDPVAIETSATLQAAAATASANGQAVAPPIGNRPGYKPEPMSNGSVMLGTPVAAPVNGDVSMDISAENVLSHVQQR